MAKTVNLNKMASALVGEKSKVRVRIRDGVLQFLPTDRVKGINLPKGEVLIDIKARADRGTKRFTLSDELAAQAMVATGVQFLSIAGKHGWVTMRAAAPGEIETKVGQVAPAGGSVSAK